MKKLLCLLFLLIVVSGISFAESEQDIFSATTVLYYEIEASKYEDAFKPFIEDKIERRYFMAFSFYSNYIADSGLNMSSQMEYAKQMAISGNVTITELRRVMYEALDCELIEDYSEQKGYDYFEVYKFLEDYILEE